MFDLIARYMSWLYDLTGSYGITITFVTLSVMLITTPLTLSGTKSMMQMQRMQPELRKLQEKYKDDRETLNQEMLAFYQENGINPVGGCLPMFIQLPVFFVLYRIVAGLTRRHTDVGEALGAVAGGSRPGAIGATLDFKQNFNPEYLDGSSSLARDLAARTDMPFLGVDLARSALEVVKADVIVALPYLLMIVVVLLTSLFQQRQIRGRSSGATSPNPQQEMIMKVLPWMLPVFSFGFQAALVLYFIISNLYRIGQQAYITRTMYGDDHKADNDKADDDKAGNDKAGKKKADTNAAAASSSGKSRKTKQDSAKKDSTSSKSKTSSKPTGKLRRASSNASSNGSTSNRTGPRRGSGRTTAKKAESSNRAGPRREAAIEPKPRKKKRK